MYNNQNNYNQGYSTQPDYSAQPDYSTQPDYSAQPDYSTQGDQNQPYTNQQYGYSGNAMIDDPPKNSKVNLILVILILILIALLALLGISFMNKKSHYAVVFVNGENIEALVVEEGKTVSEKIVTETGFAGWYEGDTKYDFSKKVTGNVILKAKYDGETGGNNETAKTYKVTFDTNGGTTITSQNVKENGVVTKPVDPILENYTFVEWQLNGTTYDFTAPVVSDITLTAKWLKNTGEITYEVAFDTDGGSTVSKQIVKEKGKATKPKTPTKTGYTFIEWQLNGKKYDFNTIISENITLKAVWEAKEAITITFDSDGGNTIKSQVAYKGEKVGTLPTPKRDGYTFDGWYDGTTKYTSSTIAKTDVTLKAKWVIREKLTINFDSDGGSAVASIEVYTGEKVGTLPTPTREGYKFDGWYDGTTKYTSSTTVTKSVTLKAKWISEAADLLSKAKGSIKSSYNIETGGTEIKPTYSGCTITHLTQNDIAKITRDVNDKTITLRFEIQCGDQKETVTSNGIIKASPYKYVATANSNMQNYDLTVKNGSATLNKNGTIYSMGGSYLSDLSSGKAIINNDDIAGYPNYKMIISGDSKTIYVIKK
ncbi:MAG: InlB B-repeat-containing protein [Bacilli bacterium]|nr:InlB B-repeat-containing protein [Bacilli bacterium]MBQ6816808.1 InlB B-repeat-containing protein [Bacilli bacterium]